MVHKLIKKLFSGGSKCGSCRAPGGKSKESKVAKMRKLAKSSRKKSRKKGKRK